MTIFFWSNTEAKDSIYNIKINDINGDLIDLNNFRGKEHILVFKINTMNGGL